MRILVFWLATLMGGLLIGSPAVAETALADSICTASSPVGAPFSEIIAQKDRFDCSDDKLSITGPRVWVKIPFETGDLPDGQVEVQGDNNGLSTMAILAVLQDGTILSQEYDRQEVSDRWRPKGSYGIPVPGSNISTIRDQIQTVYLAIDHPQVGSSVSLIRLASTEKWDQLKLPLSVLFAILCGMAMMPFFYSMFFYVALKHPFMLWHSATIIATVLYTFSSSGLIFIPFPETSLSTKMLINYWSLALGVGASGFFMLGYVEPGKIARSLKPVIIATSLAPIMVTGAFMQFNEGSSLDARNYYHASFLPYFLVILYTMFHAAKRGSRAIWFPIIAWTPILIFSLDRVARGMDLYIGFLLLDYGLYFALILETIILAFGVATRILHLRRQHEETLRQQVELTLLADTDGLTSLSNRRAFEGQFKRNQSERNYNYLAILDIDFFKRVNDQYGHEIGDEVLRVVGRELAKTRHFASRIGGEEFTLLLKTDTLEKRKQQALSELTEICQTLIRAIHDQVPEIREPVTFSVGIAAIPKRAILRTVMANADRRLYDAKNNGRNQIVSFDMSPPGKGKSPGSVSA